MTILRRLNENRIISRILIKEKYEIANGGR
jgi:hypothetical protein